MRIVECMSSLYESHFPAEVALYESDSDSYNLHGGRYPGATRPPTDLYEFTLTRLYESPFCVKDRSYESIPCAKCTHTIRSEAVFLVIS